MWMMRAKVRLKSVFVILIVCCCFFFVSMNKGKYSTEEENEYSKRGRRVASIKSEDLELFRNQIQDTNYPQTLNYDRQNPILSRSALKDYDQLLFSPSYGPALSVENEDIPEVWEPSPELERKYEERRQHVKEVCKKNKLDERSVSSQPNAWEFLINKDFGLIWCSVFKAASSTWYYNFNILAGYTEPFLLGTKDTPVSLARKKYPRPSVDELDRALNSSSRSVAFMISRHPFERLVSAYRDKLQGGKRFYRNLAKKIISSYPELGPSKHIQFISKERKPGLGGRKAATVKYNAPSFSQFVQFLVDSSDKGMDLDEHWTPMNKFCSPCLVDFDVFAKVETLNEDGNYIIYKSGIRNEIKPKRINRSKSAPTKDVSDQYLCNLTASQMERLIELYQLDLDLFNYDYDKYRKCVKSDTYD